MSLQKTTLIHNNFTGLVNVNKLLKCYKLLSILELSQDGVYCTQFI